MRPHAHSPRAPLVVAFVVGGLAVVACGGPERPDPDEAFRQIQIHEASIAHGSAQAARCEPEGPCPAADAVCRAAAALCEIAEQLDDADADRRCELGRRACGGG